MNVQDYYVRSLVVCSIIDKMFLIAREKSMVFLACKKRAWVLCPNNEGNLGEYARNFHDAT